MLDELPSGAEPASPRPLGPNPHGWSSSNRFVRASDSHYTGTDGSDFERYDGLDYLLLHNLYAIALPDSWELGGGGGAGAGGAAGGAGGTGTGAGPLGGGGSAGAGGSGLQGGTGATPAPADSADPEGCGCRAVGQPRDAAPRWWLLLGCTLLAATGRRRRAA